MDHDTLLCPICAAEFASSAELVRHEKAHHTQQGIGGVNPSSDYQTDDSRSDKPRQGREFTRRNSE